MQKQVIGSVAQIVLPEISSQALPARIDTGAQTSALWASQITETSDGLQVVFFGEEFSLYSGQPIRFTEYAETVVTSSNGTAERRYKVQLLCIVGDRHIRTWFTLANRATQTYPALLGRNTLRGKFLVDVSLLSQQDLEPEQAAYRIKIPKKEQ